MKCLIHVKSKVCSRNWLPIVSDLLNHRTNKYLSLMALRGNYTIIKNWNRKDFIFVQSMVCWMSIEQSWSLWDWYLWRERNQLQSADLPQPITGEQLGGRNALENAQGPGWCCPRWRGQELQHFGVKRWMSMPQLALLSPKYLLWRNIASWQKQPLCLLGLP